MINAEQAKAIAKDAVVQDMPIILKNILSYIEEHARYGNGKYRNNFLHGAEKTYMWSSLHQTIKRHITKELEALGYSINQYADDLQIHW